MKKTLYFIEIICLIFCISCSSRSKNKTGDNLKGKITISGAFALYPLTIQWAENFKKTHPDVSIDISAGGAGKGMVDVLSGMVDLAMFSREVSQAEKEKGALEIAVAKDAVFPTINEKNPELKNILEKGLTKELFNLVFTSKLPLEWDRLLNVKSHIPIHVYTRSDACGAAATWAAFIDKKQEDLFGTGVYGDPGLADAVKNDVYGVGFNNLVYIYDQKTNKCSTGLRIIPIDQNNNRKIDPEENFCQTMSGAIEAIRKDQYPSPPSRKLYIVSKGKVTETVTIEFLKYILTDGQQLVPKAGYINLDSLTIATQIEKLDN